MNEQIESAIKGARGYWFVDGFIEMATGGLFVLLAALVLLRPQASPDTFAAWFVSTAAEISAAKVIGILAAVLILWWLKDHFTYPRTGFVRGQRVTAGQILSIARNILLFLLVPILGLLGVSLLLTSSSSLLGAMPGWFPIGLGMLWAMLLVLAAGWLGIPRFRILAGVTLFAGVIIGAWQFAAMPFFAGNRDAGPLQRSLLASVDRTLMSLGWLVLICGIALVISGLVTFFRYRKENPAAYVENA